MDVVRRKIKSIKKLDKTQDVYCVGTLANGTMIANGIITKNCDALRYAIYSHKIPNYKIINEDLARSLSPINQNPGFAYPQRHVY